MNKKLSLPFVLRCIRRAFRLVGESYDKIRLHLMLVINNVKYGSIRSNGMLYFCVGLSGVCRIGKNFSMNNGLRSTPSAFRNHAPYM